MSKYVFVTPSLQKPMVTVTFQRGVAAGSPNGSFWQIVFEKLCQL
jgi:hypothetical protein